MSGGTSGPGFNDDRNPVFAAELWDPATETWTTMASAQIPRLYHSAAVLLRDGRVLTTGGTQPVLYPDVEVYEPPYLFKGARPTITAAPTSVTYGQTFLVQTPDATKITDVTWIRLPSVTHAFDMNQWINRLSFSKAAGRLTVVAPAGHYMLFIHRRACRRSQRWCGSTVRRRRARPCRPRAARGNAGSWLTRE